MRVVRGVRGHMQGPTVILFFSTLDGHESVPLPVLVKRAGSGNMIWHCSVLWDHQPSNRIPSHTVPLSVLVKRAGRDNMYRHFSWLRTGPAAVKHVRLFSGLHVHSSEGKVGFSDFEGKQAVTRC